MDFLDFLNGALVGAVVGGLVAGSIGYALGLEKATEATACQACGNPVDERPFCDGCLPEMVTRDWAA
jgi:uncharacterized protein YcfJ